MKVKTGVLLEKKNASVHERELGEVGSKQVLVKMDTCNLCTTDYQQWLGLREHQGYPMAGGHENSGIVVEIGRDVKNVAIGDRVAFGYNFCGECPECRKGNTYMCSNASPLAETEDGYRGFFGYAQYKLAESKYTIVLDKDVKPEHAGFVEPLGTVLHGLNKLELKPHSTVAIVGAGTMGLLNGIAAKTFGARVIFSELSQKKIQRARNLGFEVVDAAAVDSAAEIIKLTKGNGADIVIGAVGSTKAYEQCIAMLKKQKGKFLVFAAGYPEPELKVSPNEVHYREIEIIGTMGGNISDFELAAEYLSKGIIDVSSCLEDVKIGLKDIQKAFEVAATPDMYRVTIDCQDV